MLRDRLLGNVERAVELRKLKRQLGDTSIENRQNRGISERIQVILDGMKTEDHALWSGFSRSEIQAEMQDDTAIVFWLEDAFFKSKGEGFRHIDPGERIITCEDSAELQLQQPHVVRLETRPPNLEGAGEISMRDLVKNCLRMRPERIIVGEVRGPEAFDLLQAMNTGHDGSMGTIHANNPREAISRDGWLQPAGQSGTRADIRSGERDYPGTAPPRRFAKNYACY